MDEAYETFIRRDENCDSLEPSFSGLSIWVSFTLRAWMMGLGRRGGEVSFDRRLCLIASLFYNSVFLSQRHRLSSLSFSPFPPLLWPYGTLTSLHLSVSAGCIQRSLHHLSKCGVNRILILKSLQGIPNSGTACPGTWAVHWLRWRQDSAVRDGSCLKRQQGAALPACQVCECCCDQSIFIIAVWPWDRARTVVT